MKKKNKINNNHKKKGNLKDELFIYCLIKLIGQDVNENTITK